ncbi:hypothetical protein SAMD00019534_121210 [Acytostelium subglobosum LB1]|uniref:hypothetical protein n=1 Tax=Acytostelium subglobosum LB1 TaxID=1410327 RepID=UPI000644BBDF|nr:hypothetical protein SAMD00019534_121210 [Acytostelium subglobosum LB1]GAM28945.1 hypothetical protein SAMD00019534_121210 [Acytostelium subglobosum LB1]|eukprot:XP_012748130.1 hypothetical protein SAMD00019534_121210 [Acytostelium subglobosum LB1]
MLLLLLSTSTITHAELPINSVELNSLRWVVQQYRLPWSMQATTCSGITSSIAALMCVNNTMGTQSIIQIRATSETLPPQDNGIPNPSLTKLIFPYLKEFQIYMKSDVVNKTFNILDLLDNANNVNLTKTNIDSSEFSISFTPLWIPPQFPKFIPLSEFYCNRVLITSIIPASLFGPTLSVVYFSGASIFDNTTVPTPKVMFNSTQYNGKLRQLRLIYPKNQPTSKTFSIDAVTFPKLETLAITFSDSMDIYVNSPTLDTIDISSSKLCHITIMNATNVTRLFLNWVQPTSLDLSHMVKLYNLFIINANLTTFPTFQAINPPMTSLVLDYNQITSIPNIQMPQLNYFSIKFNPTLNSISETVCRSVLFFLIGSPLVNGPDCLYCYYKVINEMALPTSFIKPPGFICDIQMDKTFYVLTENITWIEITGKNLGGYFYDSDDHDSNYNAIVPNYRIKYDPPFPEGSANIMISKNSSYYRTISWVTDKSTIDGNNIIAEYSSNLQRLELTIPGIFNTTYNYTINVSNNQQCQVNYISTNLIRCSTTPIQLTQEYPVFVNISSPYLSFNQSIYINYYPLVTSIPPILANQTNVTIYGNFGYNVTGNDTKVVIDKLNCTVLAITNSSIVCHLDSTLNAGPANLTISVRGSIYTSSSDLMVVPLVIKDQCGNQSKCHGNGVCVRGQCQCFANYGGLTCKSQINPNTVISLPVVDTPTTMLTSNVSQFNISIVSIQELDQLDHVVKEVLTTSWSRMDYTNGALSINQYNLINKQDDYLDVIVRLQTSSSLTVIQFAGTNTTLDAHSIKMSMKVNGWRYRSNLNTLRIMVKMDSGFTHQDSACHPSLIKGVNPVDGNLQYVKMNYNGMQFYGSFLPVGLSDGRPFYSLNELINDTYFGIHLPQCHLCDIDPNFAMLVDPGNDEEHPVLCGVSVVQQDDKFSTWKIATIAVVCGVTIIAAVGVAYVVFKKNKQIRLEDRRVEAKLKEMSTVSK